MKRLFIDSVERLAHIVAEERKASGVTQAELAEKAGVSRRFVIEVEKGHPRAELDKVLALLHALNIRPYALPPIASTVDPDAIDLDEHLLRYSRGE